MPFSTDTTPTYERRTKMVTGDDGTERIIDEYVEVKGGKKSDKDHDGGAAKAAQYVRQRHPERLTVNGGNWTKWSATVERARSMLSGDLLDVWDKSITCAEAKREGKDAMRRFERAAMQMSIFVEAAAGTARTEPFLHGDPEGIWDRLERRFALPPTVAETYKEFTDLVNTRMTMSTVDELTAFSDDHREAWRTFEALWVRYAAEKGEDGTTRPAEKLPKRLYYMMYVSGLTSDLRNLALLHFGEVKDAEQLEARLASYMANEKFADGAIGTPSESAFAAKASYGRKVAPATPSANRLSRPPFISSPAGRSGVSSSPAKMSPITGRTGHDPIRADRLENFHLWPHGIRANPITGDVKFRTARDHCYTCWGDDHYSSACPLKGEQHAYARGRAKADELAKHGIIVEPLAANALVSFKKEADMIDAGAEDPSSEIARALAAHGTDARALSATREDPESFNSSWFFPPEYNENLLSAEYRREDSQYADAIARVVRPKATAAVARTIASNVGGAASAVPRMHTVLPATPMGDASAFVATARFANALSAVRLGRDEFISDTGATIHLTDDRSNLHDFVELPERQQVQIGGAFGGGGKATGKGTLIGDFDLPGGGTSRIEFRDVFYAPGLGHKLLSGFQVSQTSYHARIGKEDLRLHSPSGEVVAVMPVDRSKGAIVVRASWIPPSPTTPTPAMIPNALVAADARLWHARLGHIGEERVCAMERDGVAIGLKLATSSTNPRVECEPCASGKATRKPVPDFAENWATRPLERLHSDVWGKSPVPGKRHNEQYLFSIVDDATRFAWIRAIGSRDQVADAIIKTITMLDRQHRGGNVVRRFRRDGAKEYNSRLLDTFLDGLGIVGESTVPYAHNQNGVAERVWRSLLDTTRAFLLDAGFPRTFWAMAALAAAHLRNRTSTSANAGRTPFEAYFGRPPNVSHLRRWGCVAHIRIDEGLRTKLESKTRRCYFVGYLETAEGDERPGWLFYDSASRRFHEAVDVIWFEHLSLRDTQAEWSSTEREAVMGWTVANGIGMSIEGGEESTEAPEVLEGEAGEAERGGEEETPGQEVREPRHEHRGHDRPPAAAPSPVAPPVRPQKSPARRSGRISDPTKEPEHFVPLDGAPAKSALAKVSRVDAEVGTGSPFSFEAGLRCVSEGPTSTSLLAGAGIDIDLDPADPDVEEVGELSIDEAGGEMALLARAISDDPDSPSIRQALSGADSAAWISAINVELEAFEQRGVWDTEMVELPPGARAIPLKWVLLVKRDEYGNVIKYKARLVARGDLQREGIDYGEVFSSTIRFSTVLTLLALSTLHGWDIRRFNVTAAFLHGHLDEKHPLFAKQVPGFEDRSRPGLVRRLRRSLYGLRQAGRKWNETFVERLKGIGFAQSRADPSLFVRRREGKIAIVPIHVDDGLVIGDDDLKQVISDLSASLDDSVKEEDLTLFLGVRIRRREDGSIALDQRHYVEKIEERFGFEGVPKRPIDTPASLVADLMPRKEDEPRSNEQYRELLGALLYLAICTRPDISYAVAVCSRFAGDPAPRHWTQLKRVARYAIATKSNGIVYQPSGNREIAGFTDADHAGDVNTRRSVSGWVFTLAGAAIDWQSKRQPVVSISSTEAEYYAYSSAVREAVWLRSLVKDIGLEPTRPTILRADNRSMIILADHPTSHHRTKHFAVHASYTREKVANGEVQLEWIPTEDMAADMMTKALASTKHRRFCSMVGLADCHVEGVCWAVVARGYDLESARWKELRGGAGTDRGDLACAPATAA
ncbi:hypothetical protein JCM8202_005183 [Rhodotorula sphaerocarpa]